MDFTRREMVKGFWMASMAFGLGGSYGTAYASEKKEGGPAAQGESKLLPLPYPYDALEPCIDKETVTIHHDKHHAGYVKNFNIALRELSEARASGDYSLIKHWSRELAFHGSGHVLHTLYWANMSSKGEGSPRANSWKRCRRVLEGSISVRRSLPLPPTPLRGAGGASWPSSLTGAIS